MQDDFKLKQLVLNRDFTIEKLESDSEFFHLISQRKILITGFIVYDVEVELDDIGKIRCSFQFQNQRLKYVMLYPDYREFLIEPERWNHPTVDGFVENEACIKWMERYLSYQNEKCYSWGIVREVYEPWNGRAMCICEFTV